MFHKYRMWDCLISFIYMALLQSALQTYRKNRQKCSAIKKCHSEEPWQQMPYYLLSPALPWGQSSAAGGQTTSRGVWKEKVDGVGWDKAYQLWSLSFTIYGWHFYSNSHVYTFCDYLSTPKFWVCHSCPGFKLPLHAQGFHRKWCMRVIQRYRL